MDAGSTCLLVESVREGRPRLDVSSSRDDAHRERWWEQLDIKAGARRTGG